MVRCRDEVFRPSIGELVCTDRGVNQTTAPASLSERDGPFLPATVTRPLILAPCAKTAAINQNTATPQKRLLPLLHFIVSPPLATRAEARDWSLDISVISDDAFPPHRGLSTSPRAPAWR